MPVILATQEVELGGWKPALANSSTETHPKKRAGGVAQGVGPEFKPQYWKKKKKDTDRQHNLTYLCVLFTLIPTCICIWIEKNMEDSIPNY
jgi:hypothetical protein